MSFDNTYARLPEIFYQRIEPTPVERPGLIRLNTALAGTLGLDLPDDKSKLANIFSGNELLEGMEPLAQAYAGHQFGHFVPQLGDGRAVLLGEVVAPDNRRFDIQLKGSGKTRFSRGGDGRSPLGPVLREYIVSEAMHAFGIPTSRALAMVTTGETVHREEDHPGGVITRVASSHIRIGTFEFFAARHLENEVRILADYVIDRHYPEVRTDANPYAALYEHICLAHARLVAKWMGVGFIHGVMNTDNTALSGETIDYGPCAFMDHYAPDRVFSSIDVQGRYAYNNQPTIAQWNMACLGGCLLPLLSEDEAEARSIGESVLQTFTPAFKNEYQNVMCSKIGLAACDAHFQQVKALLNLMHEHHVDFTVAFRQLCDVPRSADASERFTALFESRDAITAWLKDWRTQIDATTSQEDASKLMRRSNPTFIPRNHRIEAAIRAAEDHNDFSLAHRLIDILKNPFEDQPEHAEYMEPPQPEERVRQTFCGT
ncbi:protein adenylyltransferase SelO [Pseudodesulfovibrio sp. zrk46]|uniref:protein adenylyltransferase SelO n=1 Tax=Pseudodesulfovibrio sp. zrk46 TaxID=2725288 RepID=UPI001449C4F4|nr:YdiU family protein [Pseudodesulfovibrio sp. zrk46]QJB56479.1 YdiU family protein [Pseudodesulfovibrio sp. zrk46]